MEEHNNETPSKLFVGAILFFMKKNKIENHSSLGLA
jgi:hypothetical protein